MRARTPCRWLLVAVVLLTSSPDGRAEEAGRWQWTISPPLVSPAVRRDDKCFGIKDPTIVFFEGLWHPSCAGPQE